MFVVLLFIFALEFPCTSGTNITEPEEIDVQTQGLLVNMLGAVKKFGDILSEVADISTKTGSDAKEWITLTLQDKFCGYDADEGGWLTNIKFTAEGLLISYCPDHYYEKDNSTPEIITESDGRSQDPSED